MMMRTAMIVAERIFYSESFAAPNPQAPHGPLERLLERTRRSYCARAATTSQRSARAI
jgi:hypothetical protein